MQSDFAQAKRRTLFAVPAILMPLGIALAGAIGGFKYGYDGWAAAVLVQLLIIGALRTVVRVVPARYMPANVRDAARADLWHLTVGWLRIAGIVAALLAVPSIADINGIGPIVGISFTGFATATLTASYLIQRWIRAAPALADMNSVVEDEPATQGLPTRKDAESARGTNYSQGSQWTAELLESAPTSRTLRINLDHVHILEISIARWRDTVRLDGEVVVGKLCSDLLWSDRGNRHREPTNVDAWYIVYINDGGRRLLSEITVTKNHVRFSRRIIKLSLLVTGACLYSE